MSRPRSRTAFRIAVSAVVMRARTSSESSAICRWAAERSSNTLVRHSRTSVRRRRLTWPVRRAAASQGPCGASTEVLLRPRPSHRHALRSNRLSTGRVSAETHEDQRLRHGRQPAGTARHPRADTNTLVSWAEGLDVLARRPVRAGFHAAASGGLRRDHHAAARRRLQRLVSGCRFTRALWTAAAPLITGWAPSLGSAPLHRARPVRPAPRLPSRRSPRTGCPGHTPRRP